MRTLAEFMIGLCNCGVGPRCWLGWSSWLRGLRERESQEARVGAMGGERVAVHGLPERLLDQRRRARGVRERGDVPARGRFGAEGERVDASFVRTGGHGLREDDLLVALAVDHALRVRVELEAPRGRDLGPRVRRFARGFL